MVSKLSERTKIVEAIASQDISTADVTSSYVSVAGYRKARAKLFTESIADTKVATIQIMQAQDGSGTGAKALSAVVTETASGAEKLTPEVEVDFGELDDGFTHIAVKVGSDDTGKDGFAVLELGDGRYGVV